ncbi:MAG: hypothetical protein K2P81_03555 [Bacteriovoracaceae bacterium]|nr:hypothetical protein [Bacteriovoracaceae bacterium]
MSQLNNLTSDEVLKQLVYKNVSPEDLLFCYPQDISLTEAALIVKNSQDIKVAVSHFPLGARERILEIDEAQYKVVYPFNRKLKTAQLYLSNGDQVIAQYKVKNILGTQEFEVQGLGFISVKRLWSLKKIFHYYHNDQFLGFSHNISWWRNKGRVLVLPPLIPKELKVFIIAP